MSVKHSSCWSSCDGLLSYDHTPCQEAAGTFEVFKYGTHHFRWRAGGIFTKDKKRR